MKLVSIVIALLGILIAGSLNTSASAAPLNPGNKIHVYGRVADVHSVTVDANYQIIEIASNTTKDTMPRIFRDRITKESQIELTPAIYEQYLKLVPPGSSQVGMLYKRPPQINVAVKQPIAVFAEHLILSMLQIASAQVTKPII